MKKIVSLILALAMCLSLTPAVFAADVPTADAEETTLTLEQAAEILGMPVEELEGLEIHKISSEQNEDGISALNLPSVVSPGIYYEELDLPANFTGAIHTLNGTKFAWGAALSTEAKKNHLMGLHIVAQYTTGYVIGYCDLNCRNVSKPANYWYKVAQSRQISFKYSTTVGSASLEPNSKFIVILTVTDT